MTSPPNEKGALLHAPIPNLQLVAAYHKLRVRAKVWRLIQKPFCAECWNIEQSASKIEERANNERGKE
jgi:hypothetical protein